MKRIIDLVFLLLLSVIFLPLVLLGSLAIVVTTGSLPFYTQVRVGECGRLFRIYKLRTMKPGADQAIPTHLNETNGPTFKARDDPRITAIGRILRRTSIDEIPQFLNVALGQMSLVGPRPPLPDELPGYAPEDFERLTVKPGLTCIWQVSGRSDLNFQRWMELDRDYVENRSMRKDISLLVRTPLAVLSMRGAR